MKDICRKICLKIGEAEVFQGIRSGLILLIPVLLAGSFSLLLTSLPMDSYQRFIRNAGSGALLEFFDSIYQATFGLLSLYMVLSISCCLSRMKDMKDTAAGVMLTCLVCFVLMSGAGLDQPGLLLDCLGVNGMFTAIFTAVGGTYLYIFFKKKIHARLRFVAEGADITFNDTITSIFPLLAVVTCFAFFHLLLVHLVQVDSFHILITSGVNRLFFHMGRSFASAFLFVFMTTLLWFFGIHGSDALETVSTALFKPAIQENIQQVLLGQVPTEIYSKTFFDVFVFMGGCGSSICLLLAIFLFANRKRNKNLAKIAAFPMIFNMNELMLFGLPVVFNPLMLVPFLATPLVSFLLAYAAMSSGWLPVASVQVEWTTPILLGGYLATGSLKGSVIQLLSIFLGTLIYRPFVRAYDKAMLADSRRNLEILTSLLKKSQDDNLPVTLTELADARGTLARYLSSSLKSTIRKDDICMYYQPQHDHKGVCIGVEALLRWKHPLFGMIYPPLAIKLAEENQLLEELEQCIFQTVARDLKDLLLQRVPSCTVSINISAQTVQKQSFILFLRQFTKEHGIQKNRICIEITEQDTIRINESLQNILAEIHRLGYLLAIDDFSMGSTSVKYLQNNLFDLVKLDGSLVQQIDTNSRSRDIVASIVYLAKALEISVLAEYVEDREKQQELERLGCFKYQGYLYSPAIPVGELKDYLNKAPMK
ncbi:PTS sugar transporter subunit IIC/EAL domain-containing protein [Aminipila butyrica]|uniref:PTS sugar transporter subunit IIC/EAL domain-containing protein n=1 Tax=Aminipila butyrica TaxID=433296 RepID=A0A858BWK6_9FIRM|nr:EAL domain-containing protein [Aminipila butyrica]QIB68466.1 PTS sugar transporter subunit IIC/EAL domain-containing protein [Aminipila butyrica]